MLLPGPAGMRGVLDGDSGPVVVLLHGQPGGALDWAPVVARLRGDHRVLAVDRPGYASAGGADATGFRGNADGLAELLDTLGVEEATVVGHSWGGGVALAFALRHPQRVAGLVLVSAVGSPSALSRLDTVLAAPVLGAAVSLVVYRLLAPRVVRRWLRRVGGGLDPDHAAAIAADVSAWRRQPTWRSVLVEQRAMVRRTARLWGQLSDVAVPTTVLVGTDDTTVPPRAAADLAGRIPGARLHAVPGGTHRLPQEQPDVVAAAVRAMTARVS